MGIIRSNAAFYLDARARGVDFRRTLTIGRQRLYVTERQLAALAARYRPDLMDEVGEFSYGDHADAFLKRFLDVVECQALDHSAYQGAGLAHDLNRPIPQSWHEQYDVVIDSGTIEHVFNLPVAIANYMQLVRHKGTLFLSTPANNLCGHGFYQFSPELFFRLFNGANGFALERLLLVTHPFPGAELSGRQTWYEVRDPAVLGARVSLMTRVPAFLMLEATRVEVVPVLVTPPLQSDYVSRWAAGPDTRPRGFARRLFGRLPERVRAMAIGWYQRLLLCSLRNRRAFRRLSP